MVINFIFYNYHIICHVINFHSVRLTPQKIQKSKSSLLNFSSWKGLTLFVSCEAVFFGVSLVGVFWLTFSKYFGRSGKVLVVESDDELFFIWFFIFCFCFFLLFLLHVVDFETFEKTSDVNDGKSDKDNSEVLFESLLADKFGEILKDDEMVL